MTHNSRMKYVLGLCSISLVAAVATPVSATEVLDLATWGGGSAKAWTEAFGKPFQEMTGIEIRLTEVPSPETAIRSQANNPQFDLVLVDTIAGSSLAREGLLSNLDPEDYPSASDIRDPGGLYADDGNLVGITPYYQYYSIVVNTDLADTGEFTSWRDLADPKWKGKLGIGQPVFLSLNDLTMMAVANGGTEADVASGEADMKGYVDNAPLTAGSLAQMNQMLMNGEVTATSYHSARVWDLRRQGYENIEMVLPEEGAIAISYAIVVPKGRQLTEGMKSFLDFIAQAEPQLAAYDIGGYIPLNAKANLNEEQSEELGMSLEQLSTHLYVADPGVLSKHHAERVAIVEQMFTN